MKEVPAFPLAWPVGWPRSKSRKSAVFFKEKRSAGTAPGESDRVSREKVSIAEGVTRVVRELRMMGAREEDVIVSTNVRPRLDGFPRGSAADPEDPGAAVYWTVRGQQKVMAIDRYDRLADNLSAISRTLEAMRSIERHGGAVILDRAFAGFVALPGPITGGKPWRDTLGLDEDEKDPVVVRDAYRKARSAAHSDKGGEDADFLVVQAAWEAAQRELGFRE